MKTIYLCFAVALSLLICGATYPLLAQTNTPTETPTQTSTETPTITPTPTPTSVIHALFPIGVNYTTVASANSGDAITDILEANQSGNIGWLSWTGSSSACNLCSSLTPPGNSNTYINPADADDNQIDVGDLIAGSPGVKNSACVKEQLDGLIANDSIIGIPAWDLTSGDGNNAFFRTRAFALVQLTSYQLPQERRISAIFRGWTGYEVEGTPTPAARGLLIDVFNNNDSSDSDVDDASNSDCLAIIKPNSNPSLRWRILPNSGLSRCDIIAGVLLPNGKILAFEGGFRNLTAFGNISGAPRVARGVSFAAAQNGVIPLVISSNTTGGPFIIVVGVLSASGNALLLKSQSEAFIIR
jgi:hypothetical protein